MSQDDRIWDGADSIIAMDSATHPSYLPPQFNAESVNRSYRGGINRTRPGFVEHSFTAESEGILDQFLHGNFQGAMAYRTITTDSQDGIVCAIGGVIYFLYWKLGKFAIHPLMYGNESNLMNTWFVQAENWVYIQNGYQNAIAWDGNLASAAFRLNPLEHKMPVGTIMAYSNGRVFVSDKFNNIYASDIIFGNGFTKTDNTQNFTETIYWQEGGSFTPPSNLGNITGMRVMPTLNLNERGQGELVVFCDRGAFSLNTLVPRDQWKDAQILKTSLIGRGNLSSWSVTGVNNEVFFRADDGWALYSNAQVDFSQKLAMRKFSREVNRWVSEDTPSLRQFESGMFFDNRFIGTVNPYLIAGRENNQSFGLNRPHRGMVILDLDHSTGAAPDASINWRWNGVWTGPQPTQLLTATIEGQERAFCFSFEADLKNHLWELTTQNTSDYAQGESKAIRSYYTTPRFNFSSSQQTNRTLYKKLIGGQISLSEITGQINIGVQYRPDSYPCWQDLQSPINLGCSSCNGSDGCALVASNPRYKRFSFPTPAMEPCQIGTNFPAPIGQEFQVQVNMEGHATVDWFQIAASIQKNVSLQIPICEDKEDCEPLLCCPLNNLDFYRTIDPAASPAGPGYVPREPDIPTPIEPPEPIDPCAEEPPLPGFDGLSLDDTIETSVPVISYDQTFFVPRSECYYLTVAVNFWPSDAEDHLRVYTIDTDDNETLLLDSTCFAAASISDAYIASAVVPAEANRVRFEIIAQCAGSGSTQSRYILSVDAYWTLNP